MADADADGDVGLEMLEIGDSGRVGEGRVVGGGGSGTAARDGGLDEADDEFHPGARVAGRGRLRREPEFEAALEGRGANVPDQGEEVPAEIGVKAGATGSGIDVDVDGSGLAGAHELDDGGAVGSAVDAVEDFPGGFPLELDVEAVAEAVSVDAALLGDERVDGALVVDDGFGDSFDVVEGPLIHARDGFGVPSRNQWGYVYLSSTVFAEVGLERDSEGFPDFFNVLVPVFKQLELYDGRRQFHSPF